MTDANAWAAPSVKTGALLSVRRVQDFAAAGHPEPLSESDLTMIKEWSK